MAGRTTKVASCSRSALDVPFALVVDMLLLRPAERMGRAAGSKSEDESCSAKARTAL